MENIKNTKVDQSSLFCSSASDATARLAAVARRPCQASVAARRCPARRSPAGSGRGAARAAPPGHHALGTEGHHRHGGPAADRGDARGGGDGAEAGAAADGHPHQDTAAADGQRAAEERPGAHGEIFIS